MQALLRLSVQASWRGLVQAFLTRVGAIVLTRVGLPADLSAVVAKREGGSRDALLDFASAKAGAHPLRSWVRVPGLRRCRPGQAATGGLCRYACVLSFIRSEGVSTVSLKTANAIGYQAAGTARALVVLAHGAGAGQQHPFMLSAARGLADRGIAVVTFDFPYMQARRRAPDGAPVLEACFEEVIGTAREWVVDAPLFIGGKSMGGRMATHLAARRVEHVAGVVVFGYPLHPPGKPSELRVAHLPSIVVPVLIVQGERDTFGTPAELQQAIEAMTAPVTLHVVPRGDHSLMIPGQPRQAALDGVLDRVATWMETEARRRWES